MKDATFQRRLRQLAAAKARYLEELKACEDEYERRFGTHPSDWDDDSWIDFARACGGPCRIPSVAMVSRDALESKRLHSAQP